MKEMLKWLMIVTAVMNGLFLAFTAVSGRHSSVQACIGHFTDLDWL